MKKVHYLYADFETTRINIPKKYKDIKDYYENCKNPKSPKVYSWSVTYNANYSKMGEHNHKDMLIKLNNERYESFQTHYNISGESWLDFVENIDSDCIMFFNNSKGYDGHFIIPILDNNGYEIVLPYDISEYKDLDETTQLKMMKRMVAIKEIILKNKKVKSEFDKLSKNNKTKGMEFLKKKIKDRWDLLLPKEYSLLVNGNSHIYEIKIGLNSTKHTASDSKNRVLIIRDNLLLFPSSIGNMGKTIAKYEIEINGLDEKIANEIYNKKSLSSNYSKTTLYKSVKELEEDGNELEYLIQDTFILWKFHQIIQCSFPRDKWKMTIGSTSYREWETIIGEKLTDKMIASGKAEIVTLKRGVKRIKYKKKQYSTSAFAKLIIEKILPTRWLDSQTDSGDLYHDIFYKYYDGGITHINEAFRGRLVKNITWLDINSSYPSQMVKDIQVPIGIPLKNDVKGYDFKFYKLVPKKKITNKKGLPFLYDEYADKREYVKTLLPNVEYRFTSITLPRFLKYYQADESDYTLTIEYSFQTMKMSDIFGDFIDKWYSIKENASARNDVILKMIAKLFLNSLYGKFGTKNIRDSKFWNQDLQEWVSFTQKVDSKYYLPLAICITESARMSLVDAVDENYHKFVYCDTDSIAIIDFEKEEFKNLELDPNKLGAWDIEFERGYGVIRRPKQYFLLKDNPTQKDIDKNKHYKLAFAGINFNRFLLPDEELEELEEFEKAYKQLNLYDFIYGKTIDNQLTPFRLLGIGLLLEETEKNIKPIWDYKPLTEQIYFKPEHFLSTIEEISKLEHITIQ